MDTIFLFLLFLHIGQVFATAYSPNLPDHGVMTADRNGFLDPNVDYSQTYGRVSDYDPALRIFKFKVENDYTRFLKPGDAIYIKPMRVGKGNQSCLARIQKTEPFYFVAEMDQWSQCLRSANDVRRGMVVLIYGDILEARVKQASKLREEILLKKDSYLKQLADANNFTWNFDLEREKLLNDFDQRLQALKNEKVNSIEALNRKKVDTTQVQGELMSEIHSLEELLKFYRLDRREILKDRFHTDYDTSAPVDKPSRVLP